ncbi:helix-turn-helix transcriptional regulator [Amycolatopsis sp. NPDC051716]|uniref:helix-turn-helix domain-containing protein n=1 Tax=Actinomycetes TaxID=1760 RepID=UPI00342A9072
MAEDEPLIGPIIERRREALGLNLMQLADRVGVTEKQISRWEKNTQKPGPENIRRLARALILTLDELLGLVPIGLDLSILRFAAWETSRNGMPVVDRHTITARHTGGEVTFAAEGDYLWSGVLRIVDHSLMGSYLSTERDHFYRGVLYFPLIAADWSAVIGRWTGTWADGPLGDGYGVLASDEDRAGRLMNSVLAHDGPLTEWPRED